MYIPNGVLSLNTEEKTRCKTVDFFDTWFPSWLPLLTWQMFQLKVAMRKRNEPPKKCKSKPAKDEAKGEHKKCPPPLYVH